MIDYTSYCPPICFLLSWIVEYNIFSEKLPALEVIIL